jgi:hypothetical protein
MMQSKSSGHGPSGSLLQLSDDDLDAVLSTLAGRDRNGPMTRLQATCTHAASQSRGASTAAIDLTNALAQLRQRLLPDGDTSNPGDGVDGDPGDPSGGGDGDANNPGDGGHGDPSDPGGGGGGPIIGTCPKSGKDQLA